MGFQFERSYSGYWSGFRGGDAEEIFLYKNRSVPGWYRKPLIVAVTAVVGKELHGAERHLGVEIVAPTSDGGVAAVFYHDGSWRLDSSREQYWDTSDEHSAVAAANGITVGVRGYRSAGVTAEHLVEIAAGALQ
jgi:hypothetical protein